MVIGKNADTPHHVLRKNLHEDSGRNEDGRKPDQNDQSPFRPESPWTPIGFKVRGERLRVGVFSPSSAVGEGWRFIRRFAWGNGMKGSKMAAFWKSPVASRSRLGRDLTPDHLFSGLAKQFRDGGVELNRQALDLVVNRVGQFNFSFLHGCNLSNRQTWGKTAFGKMTGLSIPPRCITRDSGCGAARVATA